MSRPGAIERVRELLADALERPVGERAAFLDNACGPDADLRREVESLLRAHESAGGFLNEKGAGRSGPGAEGPGPLAPGRTIGHYVVTGLIGEGGMSVVYAAKDTRLGRTVALKVLSPRAADDPAHRSRLEREARIIANLQHPNIAAIHSIEAAGDAPMLVLEFVPGKTLAERLAHGRIAPAESLRIGREIAVGLAAAHDAGVIHRDLKPANIKITPDGGVKILDFGVAKPMFASSHIGPVTTAPGTVIGTPAYMSPEQARGQNVDRRADVWAFGVVLFEMLSGRRAFDGGTTADVLAAVIGREPDWNSLPADAPPDVTRLLRRCLEKDPARRLRDAGDAALLLVDSRIPGPGAERPRRRLLRPALGLACVAAGVVAGVFLMRTPRAPERAERAPVRFSIELPRDEPVLVTVPGSLAFSPDGTALVYASTDQEFNASLNLRRLDSFETTRLPGVLNGAAPFFSPDGRWLAFGDTFGERPMIRRLHLSDGRIEEVCRSRNQWHFGGCWLDDGSLVFSCTHTSLQRAEASGEPRDLTVLDAARGEQWHSQPCGLPGARVVLFTSERREGNTPRTNVDAVEVSRGRRWTLLADGSSPTFLPPGTLVWFADGALVAQRFDPERVSLIGQPARVLAPVAGDETTPCRRFAVSSTGALAYLPSPKTLRNPDLAWFAPPDPSRSGTMAAGGRGNAPAAVLRGDAQITSLRLSPEGGRVALTKGEYDTDLWVYDLESGAPTRLTHEGGYNVFPVWSRDGKCIVFTTWSPGVPWRIRLAQSDGSSSPPRVLYECAPGGEAFPTDATPDGRDVLISLAARKGAVEGIYALALTGDEGLRLLMPALATVPHFGARFSPDGELIAYTCTESGENHVYVQTYPALDQRRTISSAGGIRPTWSGDGQRLFFTHGPRLFGAKISRAPTLAASTPEVLVDPFPESRFDCAPERDRVRFIAACSRGGVEPNVRINIVTDWGAEVRRALEGAGAGGGP